MNNGHHSRDVIIQAPPASAQGLAPVPGQAVPTPGRLTQPMANLAISVPFGRLYALLVTLKEFFGDDFTVVPNQELAQVLTAQEWLELQELLKRRSEEG